MGTHRLTRLDTADFYEWVTSLGYEDEYDFWSSLSGANYKTTVDHMDFYLTSLGYSGHIDDKFRQFLLDQIIAQGGSLNNLGTLYDWANCLYDLGLSVGGGANTILDDSGNIIRDDSGNIITD